MQFLFSGFLWTLALLAVPVIIHLFYFRRYKKVLFTQVRFLKELVEETSHRNKLRNLLILLCRMVALAALIFAFAQPFISKDEGLKAGQKAVILFIDNSHSMNGESGQGSLFSQAKAHALEIVQSFSDFDKIAITSHELSGRQSRFLSKDEAITAIEEIKETSRVNLLSKFLQKADGMLEKMSTYQGQVFLISDFQKSISDLNPTHFDSLVQYYLIPVQSISESNISLDTAYFIQPVVVPDQLNSVVYRMTNYSNQEADQIRVSYRLNGQEYPHRQISIKPKTSLSDTIQMKIGRSGIQKISLKLKDYPIVFDDEYHLCAPVDETFSVTIIYDQKVPANLQAAVSSIPFFLATLAPVNALNYALLAESKLIVLTDLKEISSGLAAELKKAMESGTNVILFPAANISDENYRSFLNLAGISGFGKFELNRKEVGRIDLEGEVFSDVFVHPNANIKLPVSQGQYAMQAGGAMETIMSYRDGSTFLSKYLVQNGRLYVFAIPWDESYSNLAQSPEVLLPFIFKAAISNQTVTRHSYVIGKDQTVLWRPSNDWIKPESGLLVKGPEEFVPSMRPLMKDWQIEIYEQVQKPGFYTLQQLDQEITTFAYNVDRMESNPICDSEEELMEKTADKVNIIKPSDASALGQILKESLEKKSFWWILILIAVISLFLESILIRFWKNS
ncbi:MAG: BatA and WFA domain-containing protein [Saprospiraceae bacterium]|nr:BatA and WFA domain-containing protein [Saprospiraceae bacterium]